MKQSGQNEAESRYKAAFEFGIDPIFWADVKTGNIIDCNRAAAEMIGLPRDKIIGCHQTFLHPPEFIDYHKKQFNRHVEVGSTEHAEGIVLTANGKHMPVLISATRLKLGETDLMQGIFRDISILKGLETDLRISEQNFKNIFDNVPIGLYQVSPAGRFIRANNHAARILGYDSPEELMDAITDIDTQIYVDPEQRKEAVRLLREYGFIANFEVKCRHKSGRHVWVSFNAKIIRDKDGSFTFHEGTSQDITERKLVEDALVISNQRFADLLDCIESVIYVVDMDTYEIIFINKHGKRIWGDIEGKICWQTIQEGQVGPCSFCTNDKLIGADGKPTEGVVWELQNTNNGRWYECQDKAIYWPDGRLVRTEIALDITEHKKTESELVKYRDELVRLVDDKIKELRANKEILEETNAALNVLLRKREEDRQRLEECLVTNIRSLVTPYVEKLKESKLDPKHQFCISIIEKHLDEIVSPLLKNLQQFDFTPRETQVSSLVKIGKTTKEIAEILGIAEGSVDTHRKSIRKKMGLNRKTNLHSRLTALD